MVTRWRLERFFGLWTAQIIVALAFAAEHHAGGYSWFNALLGPFIGSLLFGMASIATRGLAVPIGLHAAWNFGQWVLGEKDLPGLWRPVVEESYRAHVDHVGLIGYVVVFGLATAAFWRLRMAEVHREREHALANNSPWKA
jgi:membrane protease YdiL (CAAX protease family)